MVFLPKGQAAPYTGILFSESNANELRRAVFDSEIKSIRIETLSEQRDFYHEVSRIKTEEVESFRTQNQLLIMKQENSKVQNMIYFGLGVLVTGLAVYGARGLSK